MLEVEIPGSSPYALSFCADVWGGDDDCHGHRLTGYRLRGLVPKSHAVLVTRETVDLYCRDGTGAHLQPGLPTEPELLPDGGVSFRFRAPLADEWAGFTDERREFALPLDAGSVGFDFELPTVFQRSSFSSQNRVFLNDEYPLRLGSSTVKRFESDHWLAPRDVARRRSTALIKLRDRCDVLTVSVSARALSLPSDLMGGSGGGAIDGHVLCSRTTEWHVSAGARVFWPSGEVAGETTLDDDFASEPRRVGDNLCFSESLQLVANTEPLCFARNDVVRLHRGQAGSGVVPPCPADRRAAAVKALVHLPNWALPGDSGFEPGAQCDVTSEGKLACCDVPAVPEHWETLLRRALADETSPVRPDAGSVLRVEILLGH